MAIADLSYSIWLCSFGLAENVKWERFETSAKRWKEVL
jgi:hypothetical protein